MMESIVESMQWLDDMAQFYAQHTRLLQGIAVLLVVFVVTIATRLAPFVVFRKKAIPSVIIALGALLPPALIGVLVVYCFASLDGVWVNELVGCVITSIIYLATRISVLAVIGGTLSYAYLTQSGVLLQLLV